MECYNCGTILNRKTRSAEHILPNSIGGKRKAYNLLCKACNEKFGRTIDQELASNLARIYSILTTSGNNKVVNVPSYDSFQEKPAYFRSIAKICLNYYLSKGYAKQYCEGIKAFIKGENPASLVHYYIPDNRTIHDLAETEVSHLIHLRGSKESGVLYAYIELFNMQSLIVIFTMDYDGKDIDVTYCRDVMKNEELSKKIELGLSRDQLAQPGATSASLENRWRDRFERLLRIIQNRPS